MRYEVSRIMKQNQVMELVYGNNSSPGKMLGRHFVGEGQVIGAYHPDAIAMTLKDEKGREYEMESVERHPVYAAYFPTKEQFSYEITMYFRDGNTFTTADPYVFKGLISPAEEENFQAGIWTDSYRKLGAHPMVRNGVSGVHFAVWAPSARRVSLVGDFNFWNGLIYPMNRVGDSGIYELFVPGVQVGQYYKYEIKTWDGRVFQKADPCGRQNQSRHGNASKIVDFCEFAWEDKNWITHRKEKFGKKKFVSIADGTRQPFGAQLLEKDYGKYTHLLISGCDERRTHRSWTKAGIYSLPFEESSPADLKSFVNTCHKKGVGVILQCDFGYFHDQHFGLAQFDGSSLYGFSDERKHYNNDNQMYRFSYSRPEVRGYLHAAMMYWLKEYHIDGIAFEKQEEAIFPRWESGQPNCDPVASRKCSITFFEESYQMIKGYDPGILVLGEAAEDDKVIDENRLAGKDIFDYYIDHRIINYPENYWNCPEGEKTWHYYGLTQPLHKNGLEKSLIILNKDRERKTEQDSAQKFKMTVGFLAGVPGMKQWQIKDKVSPTVQNYVEELLNIIYHYDALHNVEYGMNSFEWINGMNAGEETVSYVRKSSAGENLLFISNFSYTQKRDYRVGVPSAGEYILVSDSSESSGRITGQYKILSEKVPCDLRNNSITVLLRPLTTLIFKYKEEK